MFHEERAETLMIIFLGEVNLQCVKLCAKSLFTQGFSEGVDVAAEESVVGRMQASLLQPVTETADAASRGVVTVRVPVGDSACYRCPEVSGAGIEAMLVVVGLGVGLEVVQDQGSALIVRGGHFPALASRAGSEMGS